MADPLFWRLVYPDDHVEDEPDTNASILLSRPGAVELHVCRLGAMQGERVPVSRIPLVEDDVVYRPIFYRRRSMAPDATDVRLDATVIGRGLANVKADRAARRRLQKTGQAEVKFNSKLWASFDGATFGDCPQELIDPAAIENLLLNSA